MRNGVAAGAAYRPAKVVPKAEKKYQQGLALMQQGRWEEAARAFEAAIERSPKDPLFWLNLAQARRKLGDAAAAERAARRALELDPRSELAQGMLADALSMQGRAAAPTPQVGKAHQVVNEFLQAGVALLQAEQFKEATEKFMQALRHKPDCVAAHMGLGNAFARLGAPLLAAECFRTAVTLAPGDAYAWSALVHQSMHACHWERLDADLRGLAAAQASHPEQQPVAFTHLSIPGATAAEHLRSAAAFARAHIGTPQALPRVTPSERRPGRIRVGYLSSDFCEHATSYLLAHVLELHDRDRFEIFLYSYGPDDRSPMRRRIEVAAEHFVELREAGALAMAERIRADAIDILVDLKGYTYGSRPEVLGYRAAPIQVNFLGYPGTLGTPLVDYIVTDPVVTPPEAANDYVEKFAYLPDCYQPNDRKRPIGPPVARAECGLPDGGFVFCCFNNTYKITPAMFDVWCRLLGEVEGSVLWLLDANLQARDNLRAEARARGVDPERLVFAPKLPLAQHLARLANADLVLDTLPYNAHTTASDALWAGVPIVTCPGETFASRVAASLLHAAESPELVAGSIEEYASIALRLAREPSALAALKERLRSRRHTCALFDSERYARNLEALYERMFERWLHGEPAVQLAPLAASGRVSAAARATAATRGVPAERIAAASDYRGNARTSHRRVAVVTPYYKEDRATLQRCIDSVKAQGPNVTHILVADGFPQDWIADTGAVHVRLSHGCADAGNSPRALGALLAISRGCDAICFLDGDNWLDADHVATCFAAAAQAGGSVALVAARRRWVRNDGSVMPVGDGDDACGHVDTSCLFVLPPAFHTVARWAAIPRAACGMGDRVYKAAFEAEGLPWCRTGHATVNYLCTYESVFRAIGEAPPPYAKANFDPAPLAAWWAGLPGAERAITHRLLGASLDFGRAPLFR